jgi:hypothetical protein
MFLRGTDAHAKIPAKERGMGGNKNTGNFRLGIIFPEYDEPFVGIHP